MTRPCGRSVTLRAHLQDRFVVLVSHCYAGQAYPWLGLVALPWCVAFPSPWLPHSRLVSGRAHVGSEPYLGERALPHTRPSRPRPACAGYPVGRPSCSVCLNYLSICFVDERTEVGEVHLVHPRSYGGVLLSRLRRVEIPLFRLHGALRVY